MKDLILKLVDLGMTQLEASIYVNLLSNKSLTASEISRLSRINRTQTYDILKNLIQKGICSELRGNIKRYSAVDPEKVLSSLEKKLDEKKLLIKDLNDNLAELFSQNNDKNPLDFLQVLSSRNSIISKIEDLESNAQKEVLAFNKPPYAMNIGRSDVSQIYDEIRDPEQQSLDRGVSFRSLYEIEDKNKEEFLLKVKHFQQKGENVRISKHLPFKMFIFDKQTVMLALRNKADISLSFTTMIFEHTDFAEAMAGIFEIYWQKAQTVSEYKKSS